MRGPISRWTALAGLLALLAPAAAVAGDATLATVGAERIGEAYFREAVSQQTLGSKPIDRRQTLQHLVERKLLAQVARERWGANREGVEADLARQEAQWLALRYQEAEVDRKVQPVTDAELGKLYVVPMLFDVDRYACATEQAAKQLAADPGRLSRDPQHLQVCRKSSFTDLRDPDIGRALPPELLKALPALKPAAWYGVVPEQGEFAVYQLTGSRPLGAEAAARERETLRGKVTGERLDRRFVQVLDELKKRYGYEERGAVVAEVESRREAFLTLPADTVIVTVAGRPFTVADLRDAVAWREMRSNHPVQTARGVAGVFRQAVMGLFLTQAARDAGLDKSEQFAAHRAVMTDQIWAFVFTKELRAEAAGFTEADLKAAYEKGRPRYPRSFEEERATVERQLANERIAALTVERLAEAKKRIPVVIADAP
jgi:hypothetical protein